MNCKNIFIVSFGQEPEIKQVRANLIVRYGDRNLNEVNPSYKGDTIAFEGSHYKQVAGDTGIYAISHGLQGFQAMTDNIGLDTKANVGSFVNWLLGLVGQGFKVRK